jgi:hypothetical protein
MDTQLFIACLALAAFAGFAVGYIAREIEGFHPAAELHSGPDDVESRARRVQ